MPNNPILAIGNQAISFGTVEVDQSFGTVEQASLTDFMTEYEIPDAAGGIQAVLITNPGLEFKFTALFTNSQEKPAKGTPIAFPYANVTGNVMQSDTAVTANTLIIADRRTVGGTIGHISTSVSAGSSFTINSSSSAETSTFTITVIVFP